MSPSLALPGGLCCSVCLVKRAGHSTRPAAAPPGRTGSGLGSARLKLSGPPASASPGWGLNPRLSSRAFNPRLLLLPLPPLPSFNLLKGDFSCWKFLLRQHPTPPRPPDQKNGGFFLFFGSLSLSDSPTVRPPLNPLCATSRNLSKVPRAAGRDPICPRAACLSLGLVLVSPLPVCPSGPPPPPRSHCWSVQSSSIFWFSGSPRGAGGRHWLRRQTDSRALPD